MRSMYVIKCFFLKVHHTPPEWAYWQKSRPEKWYTTYCKGPSSMRVEFLGENHLLLICGKIPNQTFWITKYLDFGLNSDLFKKKIGQNLSTNSKVIAVQKWLPFSKNNKKLLSETVQTCPIWTNFFFK